MITTPRSGAPASQKSFGPPTCVYSVRETTTKFCTVIKLDVRKDLHGRQLMLTCDQFAVDNLLVTWWCEIFYRSSALPVCLKLKSDNPCLIYSQQRRGWAFESQSIVLKMCSSCVLMAEMDRIGLYSDRQASATDHSHDRR